MSSSLNDILTGSTEAPPAPPPPAEAAPTPAPEAKAPAEPTPAEQPRGSDGKFVAKAPESAPAAPASPSSTTPTPTAPPAEEMTPKERAAFAAVQDERRKRQELERRLGELEKAKTATEPPKTFWDDPEGAIKHAKDEVNATVLNMRLSTAEAIARSKYQDFDQNIEEFAKILEQTPGLHSQWLSAPDPAEFAYRLGKNQRQLQEAGSLDALTDKIRKETEARVRAQVEGEFKAKQEALERDRAALPPTLSDVRGAAGQPAKPVWSGPTPLDQILSRT